MPTALRKSISLFALFMALAGLAAISLLVSATAATTFALIPAQAQDLDRLSYLIIIMFIAVLLAWLTVSSVIVLACFKLVAGRRGRASAAGGRTSGRHQRAGRFAVPRPVRAGAALLVLVIVLPGAVGQAAGYGGEQTNSLQVSAALPRIERSLPSRSSLALSVSTSNKDDRYRVLVGLDWALTADGYSPDIRPGGGNRPIPQVVVVIRGRTMTVRVRGTS